MGNYADALRANNYTGSDIADLIEAQLTEVYVINEVSNVTTNSSTYVDLGSLSQSVTVAAGDWVFTRIFMNYGLNTAAVQENNFVALFRDSTELTSMNSTNSITSGSLNATDFHACQYGEQPGAGTYTYKARWKNSTGAARTIASARRQFHVMVFRVE
jgi:hypothetical protein